MIYNLGMNPYEPKAEAPEPRKPDVESREKMLSEFMLGLILTFLLLLLLAVVFGLWYFVSFFAS